MNTDELLAAGDPYPERSVEGLALDAESHALMEEIMSTPTNAPPGKEPPVRRRPRWLVPVAAAATVAAVVAGAVFLIDPQAEQVSPTDGGAAAPSDDNANTPSTDVPPPTADDLRYVVIDAPGWSVTSAAADRVSGSMAWSDGESTLDMNWYPADEYRKYLKDRTDGDYQKARASLLGQRGWAFRTRYTDSDDVQWWTDESAPKASGSKDDDSGETGRKVLRVQTMLPPVGKWFLGFDVEVPNEAAYRELIASLRRVDRRTWLDAREDPIIRPADAQSFLDEVGRDVPMPPGLTVTPDDLELPEYPHEARLDFLYPVMCGWAEEYADGNESALQVLQDSRDWPAMDALAPVSSEGALIRSEVDRLAKHPNYRGWRAMWGC